MPVKVRTIPEDDWQQSNARERKTKQDHGRHGHLRERDLAEEKPCSPKATSRCKSKHGESMNVPLEHCFRL